MPTLEEQLKKLGLGGRYKKVKSGEIKVPGFDPSTQTYKKPADAITPTPTPTPTPTVTPTLGAGLGADIKPKKDPRDVLIERLTKALTAAEEAPSLTEEYKTIQEERGIPEYKEAIGTFDEELGKARDLLSDLDSRIRRGVSAERARTIPMPLITGRAQEIREQAGAERGDIISVLESLGRGREAATGAYEREAGEARDILGLKREERAGALGRLGEEIGLRTGIKALTEEEKLGTSVVEVEGRLLLINTQTGETIKDLGIAPVKTTAQEEETQEVTDIESRLRASTGTDGFIDPGVFMDERRKSTLGPEEFNKRFGSLLSPQERKRLGIEKTGPEETVEEYIDEAYLKEKLESRLNIKKVLRAAGVAGAWIGQEKEYQKLLTNLMTLVQNYRKAEYNDDEIWEVILDKINEWEK